MLACFFMHFWSNTELQKLQDEIKFEDQVKDEDKKKSMKIQILEDYVEKTKIR